jgi:hypothetical protein
MTRKHLMSFSHSARLARDVVFASALGLSAACSNGPAALLPPVEHDAQGSWGRDTHGAVTPGESFVLALTEFNGAITGTGSFAADVGPYGSLRATGTVKQDSVRLQIVFAAEPTRFPALPPDTAQFAGVLTSKNEVAGRLTRFGTTQEFDLMRLTNGYAVRKQSVTVERGYH